MLRGFTLILPMASRWFGQGSLDTPSANVDACPNKTTVYSKPLAPCRHWQGLATESQQSVGACVSILFLASSPSAIAGLVVAVIVDAVNRVLGRRSRPHVRNKILEPVPSLADLDSSGSVVWVVFAISVLASLNHGCPDFVGRRVRRSVSCTSCPRKRSFEATAAFGVPVLDRRKPYFALVAAVASAKPDGIPSASRRSVDSQFPNERQAAILTRHGSPFVVRVDRAEPPVAPTAGWLVSLYAGAACCPRLLQTLGV